MMIYLLKYNDLYRNELNYMIVNYYDDSAIYYDIL